MHAMMRRALRGLVNCAAILLLAATSAAGAASRSYTIDDVLKLEHTGAGLADPSGRWIVFEWAPPYDTQPDYSVNHVGAWHGAFQLLLVDTRAASPVATPLFRPEKDRQYWLDSFSPDGRYVAFYTAKNGHFGMGSVDLRTRRVRYYDEAPDIDWFYGREATWVGNDRFVYSAYPAGEQPMHGWRRNYGERMSAAWQATWSGKRASVTATDSGATAPAPFQAGRLLLVDARTGTATQLADGFYRDIKVSPDGAYLAALRQSPRAQPATAEPSLDWVPNRSQLVLFDLRRGGAARVVTPELDVFVQSLSWSGTGNRLAYFAWEPRDDVRTGRFRVVEAGTGATTTIEHRGLDLASARERGLAQKPEQAVWLGDRLAIFARETGRDEASFTYRNYQRGDTAGADKADWFLVDREGAHQKLTAAFESVSPVPLYADGASMAVLADGAAWRLAPGAAPVLVAQHRKLSLTWQRRTAAPPNIFPRTATLIANDQNGTDIVFVDFRTGDSFALPSARGQADAIAASPQARSVLYRDRDAAGDAVRLQQPGRPPFVVRTLNQHLRDVSPTRMERIEYELPAPTGSRTVQSCVLLPPDYQPGRRYPVIVDVYPNRGATDCTGVNPIGPTQLDPHPVSISSHLLASNGYIYFRPALPHDVIWRPGAPLAGMADAAVRGVEALVAQGYADPDRIGLYGVSQGGFSSLWLATQTNRFRAVVSANGWSDMYAHYFQNWYPQRIAADGVRANGSQSRYAGSAGNDFSIGETPSQNLDAYVRNSPLFNADKVTAPILLVHSDLDIFDNGQYEAMFTALYQQRKKARLLEYWGEGHSPSSPANIRDLWREMLGWFDRYLDVKRDAQGALLWDGDRLRGGPKN